MLGLTRLYASIFNPIDRAAPVLMPTFARLTFLATLFFYYIQSAGTKVWDRKGEEGIFDFFTLESGVYAQMFPKAFEAVGYNPTAMGFGYKLIAIAGTYGEFILPVLIVIGLFTRLAALGMIVFVFVQTYVDVNGHGAALGTWFNKGYELADERLLWVVLLLILVVRGAGPISVDHGLGRAVGRHLED